MKLLREAAPESGWTLNEAQVREVCDKACDMADVSVDETESVMCAMIDLGYASTKDAHAGWQPIETAPKDGTVVLVYPGVWSNRTCSVARWDDDRSAKRPRPYWSRDDTSSVTTCRNVPPTHWMPLPAPPETAQLRAAV